MISNSSTNMFRIFGAIGALLISIPAVVAADLPHNICGSYTSMVAGSTAELLLSSGGQYSLVVTGFNGKERRVTLREEGAWTFDGWAVVLTSSSAAASSGDFRRYHRLFLAEREDGEQVLTSALHRIGYAEYTFMPLFTKKSSNKTPPPIPASVITAAKAPVAPLFGAVGH